MLISNFQVNLELSIGHEWNCMMAKCNLPLIATHMKGKKKEHQCNTPMCNVHSPHVRVGMEGHEGDLLTILQHVD